MWCTFCQHAGRPDEEVTSHWVKSEPGPNGFVVCPLLLNFQCSNCKQYGHTPNYCKNEFVPMDAPGQAVAEDFQSTNFEAEFPKLPSKKKADGPTFDEELEKLERKAKEAEQKAIDARNEVKMAKLRVEMDQAQKVQIEAKKTLEKAQQQWDKCNQEWMKVQRQMHKSQDDLDKAVQSMAAANANILSIQAKLEPVSEENTQDGGGAKGPGGAKGGGDVPLRFTSKDGNVPFPKPKMRRVKSAGASTSNVQISIIHLTRTNTFPHKD